MLLRPGLNRAIAVRGRQPPLRLSCNPYNQAGLTETRRLSRYFLKFWPGNGFSIAIDPPAIRGTSFAFSHFRNDPRRQEDAQGAMASMDRRNRQ
jgi:hypothetical protein